MFEALKTDQVPEACLISYQQAIKNSFILNQMKVYKKASNLLALERLYQRYPQRFVQVSKEVFLVNSEGQSKSLGNILKKVVFKVLGWKGIKDIWRFIRMGRR